MRSTLLLLGFFGLILSAAGCGGCDDETPATGQAAEAPATANAHASAVVAQAEPSGERALLANRPEPVGPPVELPAAAPAAQPVAAAPVAAAAPRPPSDGPPDANPETAAARPSTSPARPAGGGYAAVDQRAGVIVNPGCAVSLNRAVLAAGVEDREPVGTSTRFSTNEQRVYVFLDVSNPNGPEHDITVRWDHLNSPHVFTQTIAAGQSVRWRTWVYHTVRRWYPGTWHVQISDAAGCLVGELSFEADAGYTSSL